MTVKVIRSRNVRDSWTVELKQRQQSFTLDYHAHKKEEALWYARMFRKALKKHNEALLKEFTETHHVL